MTSSGTDLGAITRGFGADSLTARSVTALDPVGEWRAGPRVRPLVVGGKISSDGGSGRLHEASCSQ